MKPIPTRIQRIIAFIPMVNLFCLPIFIYNSFFAKFTLKDYLRGWWFCFFPAVFLAILRELVVRLFPIAGIIVRYILDYVIAVCVGYRLASCQDRY